MGLILDTSILISEEKGKMDLAFVRLFTATPALISAITASEFLHGIERETDAVRKSRRQTRVEAMFKTLTIIPFDLAQARMHAQIWSDLVKRGQKIGAYDLIIAAAGLTLGHEVATLNLDEFQRVTGLKVVDARPFLIS